MDEQLGDAVRALADELEVPGVAVGVFHDGEERYAFHGVTSVEHPLPVDGGTLFQFGSTGKTFTSVALLRLVEAGTVDLDAPVRTYVPELALRDPAVAERVTVLQLLNHTAGWAGDDFTDTGNGDDALARYVEHMVELPQLTPPGTMVSYNNAALSLAGRVIEKVTGATYEAALKELVLDPLGLGMTMFFANDVMTRRFVVGHRREPDGTVRVLRPWASARAENPMGGMAGTASDQVRWARFHLDEGQTLDGEQVVAPERIRQMQRPTVESPGSDLGDAVGISWLLSTTDGERMVAHGGATLGQYSGFTMAPDRRFAVISLTNSEPNGPVFNRRIRRWALATYLGVNETDPAHEPRSTERLAEYAGRYETVSNIFDVRVDGDHLLMKSRASAALIAQLGEDVDTDEEPIPLWMIPDHDDRYTVPTGNYAGARGYFTRDAAGSVTGLHDHGRFAQRTGDHHD